MSTNSVTLATEHEAAGYIKSFKFSDGKTISKCCAPGCHYGTGHGDSNLYTGRHTDSPVEEPIEFEQEPVLALDEEPAPVAGDDSEVIEVEDADTGEVTEVLAEDVDETAGEGWTLEESAGQLDAA